MVFLPFERALKEPAALLAALSAELGLPRIAKRPILPPVPTTAGATACSASTEPDAKPPAASGDGAGVFARCQRKYLAPGRAHLRALPDGWLDAIHAQVDWTLAARLGYHRNSSR